MPLPPAAAQPAVPPLSAEHLFQLEAARKAARRIRRAVAVASGDGWSVAAFAALTFVFGLGSVTSAVMGVGMGVIAFVELRAAGRLRRFDAGAARVLGFNQVALACLLVAYAVWRIYSVLTGPGEYAAYAASDPQLGQMLKPVEDLTRLISLAVYAAVVAVAVFFQGGMALYYFTRAKHVRDYLAQTPAWVIAVQQAGSFV
jgi:hypothetical protein